ncbi:hypothetical protein GS966_28700 [Rhodococcus hoagii]|nr:hypothetical protein [Prescottella equi]
MSEILNGARVTVVGTTDQVSGNATVADQKLTSAEVVVQVAGIATDNARRDGQFRGNVMDTGTSRPPCSGSRRRSTSRRCPPTAPPPR